MNLRNLAAGALALAGLAFATPARAEDTLRLSLPGSDKASTLDLKATDADLDAEVLDIARGRAGGGRAGVRGRGFAGRGRIGGRGFRGAFFRPGFGRGGFRGVGFRGRGFGFRGVGFRGFAYYPRYYGGFYYGGAPGIYYSAPVGYSYGYAPCSGTVISSGPATTLRMAPVPSNGGPVVPSTPTPGKSTYPYDGGPKTPVPMPKADEAKQVPLPRTPALLEDVLVSLQGQAQGGKWNYPAYGEKPTRTGTGSATPSTGISGNFR